MWQIPMREPRALNPFRLKKKKKRKYDERKRNAYHRGVSPTPTKKQRARPDPFAFSFVRAHFWRALKNEAFFKSIGLVKTLNSQMEIFKGLFINKKASGVYAYF